MLDSKHVSVDMIVMEYSKGLLTDVAQCTLFKSVLPHKPEWSPPMDSPFVFAGIYRPKGCALAAMDFTPV